MRSEKQLMAYRALMAAADVVERNHYAAKMAAHLRRGRKRSTFQNYPENRGTHPVTDQLVKMGPKVLSEEVSPEEAMAYLHTYDVMEARFPLKSYRGAGYLAAAQKIVS